MTYGSLFTGIGGIDKGLDDAGWNCRWQVEIDPYAVRVLEKHWPNVKRYGDITNLTGDQLGPVELLCGGFPCQDLSQAGKQAGIEGTRSGLWFEYARLIRELRPRYVLIENVPGLLIHDAMRRVIGELAGLGYVGCWRSLRASEFGASHLRKRVFIVAYRDGAGRETRHEFTSAAGSTQGKSGYRCTDVAYGPLRGLGELREPSGSNGLVNGRHEELAYSSHDNGWRGISGEEAGTGPGGIRRRRSAISEPDVADSQCTGLEIGDGLGEQQLRQDAESLAPGLPDGEVAYAAGGDEVRWSPADDGANLRRNAARQHDAGSGGNLPQFAPGPSSPLWPYILRERPDLAPALAHTGHAKRKAGGSEADRLESGGGRGSRGEPAPPDESGAETPQSPLCGMADGISDLLDRAMKDRTKRLGRLGNAVVPQIAEWIGSRILEFEKHQWQT